MVKKLEIKVELCEIKTIAMQAIEAMLDKLVFKLRNEKCRKVKQRRLTTRTQSK